MPHDFDTSKRQFRSDGKLISRRDTRELIDKLQGHVAEEAKKIAARYTDKSISLARFETEMRELLKSAHIVASSVGRGGRELMTQRDWGRVGAKIKWQNSYLQKFARKLSKGTISEALTASRAQAYSSSIYISYANSYQETVEEFKDAGGDTNPDKEMLCYLEQNSEEGCPECTADAEAGPMPVSEMGELGSRSCGDFCRCEIIFEDEPEYKA